MCLLYTGDIEENPGPRLPVQKQKMFEAVMQIPSLVQTQADIKTLTEFIRFCLTSRRKEAVEGISTCVETTISSLAALHDSQSDLDNLS